jgi:hypothetical protein
MNRRRLTLASWLLLALAALCAAPIAALTAWGGRIESTLLVFGDLVYVEIDASRPRIALLLGLPLALAGAAFAARRPRAPE